MALMLKAIAVQLYVGPRIVTSSQQQQQQPPRDDATDDRSVLVYAIDNVTSSNCRRSGDDVVLLARDYILSLTDVRDKRPRY